MSYDSKCARPEKNKSDFKVAAFTVIGFNRVSGI